MKTISIVGYSKENQEALTTVIQNSEDFAVTRLYDTAEAARNIINNPTHIAITDIELPGMSGIDLMKIVRKKNPLVHFLVYTAREDDESIFSALKNGASGYILKDSSHKQIISALHEVLLEGAPMSPYIAKRVIASLQEKQAHTENLSEREMEVLNLLAKGLQYKEIAITLLISHETVKRHLRNIYGKLNVQNKVEAINLFRSL